MNIRTTRGRSAFVAALALFAALGASGARAAGPTEVELSDCIAQAEQQLGARSDNVRILHAGKFSLGDGREVVTLDAKVDDGARALRPRFYCTLGSDGRISMVHTIPRLPAATVPQVVAK